MTKTRYLRFYIYKIYIYGCTQAGHRIGLASHWPCITDTVVYPPTGSTANDREMSTHAYAPLGRAIMYLYPTQAGHFEQLL